MQGDGGAGRRPARSPCSSRVGASTSFEYLSFVYSIQFHKHDLLSKPSVTAFPDGAGEYINPCCVGGDLVIARVLPALRTRCDRVEHGQEDWGWYAWGYVGSRRLAVDTDCQDPDRGEMVARVSLHERGSWRCSGGSARSKARSSMRCATS